MKSTKEEGLEIGKKYDKENMTTHLIDKQREINDPYYWLCFIQYIQSGNTMPGTGFVDFHG